MSSTTVLEKNQKRVHFRMQFLEIFTFNETPSTSLLHVDGKRELIEQYRFW